MKYLILGGTGNLSSVTVLRLLQSEHTVHCITRGNNLQIESTLTPLGAHFHHIINLEGLANHLRNLQHLTYDFVIDFIAYNPNDLTSHLKYLCQHICHCYVFISTTAFYKRSLSRVQPFCEETIEVSDSWDYAINKYHAELALMSLSKSFKFKSLVIRLGHTIGGSIPVYLGNPGLAFLDHIKSGKPIPFVGDLDHTWSIGSAFGLSHIISSLPDVTCKLPHYYVCHYSDHQTTWRLLYSYMCSFLVLERPIFKYLTLDQIASIAPQWLPSILNHKIYPDSYDLGKLARYFSFQMPESTKEIVDYSCIRTLESHREKAYETNLVRLAQLSCCSNQ